MTDVSYEPPILRASLRFIFALIPVALSFISVTARCQSSPPGLVGPNAYAVITGGSDGIGFALAEEFVGRGISVVLVARNPEKLEVARTKLEALSKKIAAQRSNAGARPPVKIHVMSRDLSQTQNLTHLFDEIETEISGEIGYFINNAGMNPDIAVMTPEVERSVWATNYFALAELTKQAWEHMSTRGSGVIINVTSAAQLVPGPTILTYAATKAAAANLTEAYSRMSKGTHVRVTDVIPGTVSTNMAADLKKKCLHSHRSIGGKKHRRQHACKIAQKQTFPARFFQGFSRSFKFPTRVATEVNGQTHQWWLHRTPQRAG